VQVDLDGIPQPKPKSRRGRPTVPDEAQARDRTVSLKPEDEDAVSALKAAGFGKTRSAVIRRALQEQLAAVAARTPNEDGRLI
jgi:hypothetical protein